MSATKHIKKCMVDKNIKSGTLAGVLGYEQKQVFYNKLSRDKMSFDDVEKIADALGCDLCLVDRVTGKTY